MHLKDKQILFHVSVLLTLLVQKKVTKKAQPILVQELFLSEHVLIQNRRSVTELRRTLHLLEHDAFVNTMLMR